MSKTIKEGAFDSILESFDEGIAIFGADHTLLYVNSAMEEVNSLRVSDVGNTSDNLAAKQRIRLKDGKRLQPDEFPIARAFKGEETRNESFVYVEPDGRHLWLSVSCICIRDAAGELQYVIKTTHDISAITTRNDKLRFMLESAKILSTKVDFRAWLLEKAKLTVPSLADWCAIDVLVEHNGLERIAVIHTDPKMTDYLFEFEKRFPTTEKNSSDLYKVIRTGEAQFVPVVTDETIRQGTTYQYRVNAQNQFGTVNGAILSFTTTGAAEAVLPVVTTQVASIVGSTTITLRGTVNPYNTPTMYWFEYSTNANFAANASKNTPQKSAGAGATTVSFETNVSSLKSKTTYYYRTVAQNAAGTVHGSTLTARTN